jgi:hypothetical protein
LRKIKGKKRIGRKRKMWRPNTILKFKRNKHAGFKMVPKFSFPALAMESVRKLPRFLMQPGHTKRRASRAAARGAKASLE